ncbi:lactate/malate family dehydrogenase, partial [Pseudonocardia sp.]|uniref:lactate/malate family dehydrogenase n=1 Tax=Pseudonocardia sp. TaxID=60912 RepID=UPI003D101285
MTVWGAAAVDEAVAGGAGAVHVGARDVVTPLARERARELGVEIVVGSPAPVPPTVPAPPPATAVRHWTLPDPAAVSARLGSAPRPVRPPSGALYRRGAPVARATAPARGRARGGGAGGTGRVDRVVVVGAGNVGMIAAMRLADADVVDEVVLVDIDEGRAAGIALDLTDR